MPSSTKPKSKRPASTAAHIITLDDAGTALGPAQALVDQARAFGRASRAERTRAEYASQWSTFQRWCALHGLPPLPAAPSTLALYLSDRASKGIKPSSLSVANAAITAYHRAAGVAEADLPIKNAQVIDIWRGVRRTMGVAPRRVAPVLVDDLVAMCGVLPPTLGGARDRALLLVGFCMAARRSEAAALQVDDVRFTKKGLIVRIKRSKVDQEGLGCEVGVPYGIHENTCPVRALRAWLSVSKVKSGALFRSVKHGKVGGALCGRDIARIVQRTAAKIGLDGRAFSGHSLRSGLATSAAAAGKSDYAIMQAGRWADRKQLSTYVRSATLLDETNAASGLGL